MRQKPKDLIGLTQEGVDARRRMQTSFCQKTRQTAAYFLSGFLTPVLIPHWTTAEISDLVCITLLT